MSNNSIPVLAFVGLSKTGKTSLIESLIPIFCSKGIRVAVIKHHHLGFDIDIPGKQVPRQSLSRLPIKSLSLRIPL